MDYEENNYLNRRYNILAPDVSRKLRTYAVVPVAYFPNPDKEDYKDGFIIRSFTKLLSDENSTIIEVDEGQVFTLKQNIFYKTVVINWKLTGPKYTIPTEEEGELEGVFEYNDKQRNAANRIIPGIIDKLSDPLQFYKLTG